MNYLVRAVSTLLSGAMVLIVVGLLPPCEAACDSPRIISTLFPPSEHSYIQTLGLSPSVDGSSVSPQVTGEFWALGAGDPLLQHGIDSGNYRGQSIESQGWIQRPLGYPATFHTTWAASKDIDGCVDDAGQGVCVAVLLSDYSGGRGYFAVLTSAGASGNYSFVQPDNSPITLVAVPSPQIVDVSRFPALVRASISLGDDPMGQYLEAACSAAVLVGYRVYFAAAPQNGPPPAADRIAGGWEVVTGGQAASGGPLSPSSTAEVATPCQSGMDIYFSLSLVFDSGFETAYLSQPTTPVRCD